MGQEYTRQLEIRSLTPASGGVLFYDDFSSILRHWNTVSTAVDGTALLDTDKAHDGSASLRLRAEETGALEDDIIVAIRADPIGISTNLEISIFFWSDENGTQPDLQLELEFLGKPRRRNFGIEFDVVNNRFNFFNSAGAYAEIPGGNISVSPFVWHKLTLRVDNLNNEYIAMIIDGQVVDMSGLSGQDVGVEVDTSVETTIRMVLNSDFTEEIFIDQVLLQEL